MEIRWLGQDSFLVSSVAGSVITDPFPEALTGGHSGDENTIAVYSRSAGRLSSFEEKVVSLDGPGEYEVAGIRLIGIPAPAGDPATTRQVATQFVIDAEGVTVCSLGLIGALPDAKTLRATGKVDVVLVPVIGDSPLSVDQLAAAVRLMEPSVVVPAGFDLDARAPSRPLRRFIQELGAKPDEPASRLRLTSANLPEQMQVAILQPSG